MTKISCSKKNVSFSYEISFANKKKYLSQEIFLYWDTFRMFWVILRCGVGSYQQVLYPGFFLTHDNNLITE